MMRWKTRLLCLTVLGCFGIGLPCAQVPVIDDSDLREFKKQKRVKERIVMRHSVKDFSTSSTATTTQTQETSKNTCIADFDSDKPGLHCLLVLEDKDLDAFTGNKRVFKPTERRWIGTIDTTSDKKRMSKKSSTVFRLTVRSDVTREKFTMHLLAKKVCRPLMIPILSPLPKT